LYPRLRTLQQVEENMILERFVTCNLSIILPEQWFSNWVPRRRLGGGVPRNIHKNHGVLYVFVIIVTALKIILNYKYKVWTEGWYGSGGAC
jgi:hypothetical protein